MKYNAGDVVNELTLQYKIDYYIPSGKYKPKWRCLCSCGNETDVFESNLNKTKSCGHLNKEILSAMFLDDLTGKIFYWLTVKERAPDRISSSGRHIVRWVCICECGNEIIADGAELRKGIVKSCGCHRHDSIKAKYDLTNKIINSILIKQRLESKKYGSSTMSKWLCQCLECGSEFEAFGGALRRGQLTCGCINSKGEYEAAKIFKELNIIVEKAYSFPDLLSPYGSPVFFDFAIKRNGKLYLIEYQGIQHYIPQANHFGDYQREVTDPLKKEYCLKHNIPLFEIRYDEDLRTAINNIVQTINANSVPSKQKSA